MKDNPPALPWRKIEAMDKEEASSAVYICSYIVEGEEKIPFEVTLRELPYYFNKEILDVAYMIAMVEKHGKHYYQDNGRQSVWRKKA